LRLTKHRGSLYTKQCLVVKTPSFFAPQQNNFNSKQLNVQHMQRADEVTRSKSLQLMVEHLTDSASQCSWPFGSPEVRASLDVCVVTTYDFLKTSRSPCYARGDSCMRPNSDIERFKDILTLIYYDGVIERKGSFQHLLYWGGSKLK